MKKLITTFLLLTTTTLSYGQMHVGETLNDIKAEYSYGNLELSSESPQHYTYALTDKNSNDFYVYFLDVNLNCYLAVINPSTPVRLQAWVEILNKNWVILDKFHWRFYRGDGAVMIASLDKIDDVRGLCLSFKFDQK